MMHQIKQQQCLEFLALFTATSGTVFYPSEPHGLIGDLMPESPLQLDT